MNYDLIRHEFRGQDILSASQFSRPGLLELFAFAERMRPIARRDVRTQVLGGYVMGSFFFKESTRTRLSSEAAFLRLGGSVVTFTDPRFSSIMKGETFEDTIATVDCYCDIMTVRVEKEGQAKLAADVADNPVINGGDGSAEHPTQALLDGFTLREAAPFDIANEHFNIAIVGDLKYGRTVHSLLRLLLVLCDHVQFHLVSPDFLQMPTALVQLARKHGHSVHQTGDLIGGIASADAIYMVRPQLERMTQDEQEAWERQKERFFINREILEKWCLPQVLITHPLPRNAEIATDVDNLPNALYRKRQVQNGVVTRMALNVFVLGKEEKFP